MINGIAIKAQQFEEKMIGEKAEKDEKAKQLDQMLREGAQLALALTSAGLSSDFQIVPILIFAISRPSRKRRKILNCCMAFPERHVSGWFVSRSGRNQEI
ncbi:MAG: hypothetical protein JWM68_4191 [Verrucomicrobiales bacterium]|nr:hypothetical protein [Verrucomicrobiales bacterium]